VGISAQAEDPEGPLISSTKNISIGSMRPLRGAPTRGHRPGGIAAAVQACSTYFDWHPVTAGICLMFAIAAGLTLAMRFFEATVPSVGGWALYTPLNGIVIAFFLISRRRLWPWITVGYIVALSQGQDIAGASHARGFMEGTGNLLEVLIAAFCLPPYRNLKQWLLEKRLLAAFAGYALLLGPAVMSLTVAMRYPSSAASVGDLHAGFWERARVVGFAESLGVALFTPLVLVLLNKDTYKLFRGKSLPLVLGMLVLSAMATWLAFTQNIYPVVFLPYAVLLVMAFRNGFHGVALGTGVSALVVTALSVPGHEAPLGLHGLWTAGSWSASGQAILIQSYLALAVLMVFPLSVMLLKRDDLEDHILAQDIELDKLKSLDRLTGVSNRKRFDLVLEREWQRATRDPKPIALLMVDVDFMELYNDCYGHQAGDECLRLIANKMAEQPHRQYDLVSRYEGGRFSVILPGAPGKAVHRIAEEFRSEIAALDWPHAKSLFERVTVSVGWASMVPENGIEPNALIQAAECALSTAKEKGRNRVEGNAGNIVQLTPAGR
jgi:diguanylate cyclase (GGDEF)-like protein